MFCEFSGRFQLGLIALVIALSLLPARAQTPDPQPPGPAPDAERPALNPLPAEQNWSFLSDSSKRTDFFDPLKYIPLGDNPQVYLSLGFEYRIQYEYFDNWMFGAGPGTSGYFRSSSLTSKTGEMVAHDPISTKTAATRIKSS
jgi:hypothetical protein